MTQTEMAVLLHKMSQEINFEPFLNFLNLNSEYVLKMF